MPATAVARSTVGAAELCFHHARYDVPGRLSGVNKQSYLTGTKTWTALSAVASDAVYNAAGQLTVLSFGGYTEARGYNGLGQLTHLTVSGAAAFGEEYVYPASANNGQIASKKNLVSGEEVVYQYDSLQRLVSAQAGASWGQTFSYDGFGNLTGTEGGARWGPFAVDGTKNQLVPSSGWSYDLNGNVLSDGTRTYTYDVENRVSGDKSYDPQNRRVFDGSTYAFWAPDGRLLGRYTAGNAYLDSYGVKRFVWAAEETRVYFGGRLIATAGTPNIYGSLYAGVVTDRLGSVRVKGGVSLDYYPYGQEKVATGNGTDKFATYFRDANGVDYAQQRYHVPGWGRFLTADRGPYDLASAVSFNRYAYAGADPVNRFDPDGLLAKCVIGLGSEPANEAACNAIRFLINPEATTGGATASEAARSNRRDWMKEWSELSDECRRGLEAAITNTSSPAASASYMAMSRVRALERAQSVFSIFTYVGARHGVSGALLAGIAVRESHAGGRTVESGGGGRGWFQIDLTRNPGVRESEAMSLWWSADWAAQTLARNGTRLAASFPELSGDALQIAIAASWNRGLGGVASDLRRGLAPDSRTNPVGYGGIIVDVSRCF